MSNKGFHVEGKETRIKAFDQYYDELRIAKNKNHCRRYVRKRWFLRHVEFECQLYRGNEQFPRTAFMTPYEVGKENRRLRIAFMKSLDQGNERPLWRWKIKDVEAFKRKRDDHVRSDKFLNK